MYFNYLCPKQGINLHIGHFFAVGSKNLKKTTTTCHALPMITRFLLQENCSGSSWNRVVLRDVNFACCNAELVHGNDQGRIPEFLMRRWGYTL